MPRAVEIRLDPETRGVVIDTNFPNREVLGAGWEPKLFRLGWDSQEEIWKAMQDTAPTLICLQLRLVSSAGITLVRAQEFTDLQFIHTIEEFLAAAWPIPRYHRRTLPPLPEKRTPETGDSVVVWNVPKVPVEEKA